MSDAGKRSTAPVASAPVPAMAPDGLRLAPDAQGAEGFDPVRWRFIQALAQRAALHQGETRRLLDDKLARARHDYRAGFERAREQAQALLTRSVEQFPLAAEALHQSYGSGDFRQLRRSVAQLQTQEASPALADLMAYLRQHAQEGAPLETARDAGAQARDAGELKSLRYFRDTWSKLSVDRQLSLALAQAPDNAGPLNSHHLVLRSLQLMSELAPDYLQHFLSYADAMLWLEQADNGRKPAPKSVARSERDKGAKTTKSPKAGKGDKGDKVDGGAKVSKPRRATGAK